MRWKDDHEWCEGKGLEPGSHGLWEDTIPLFTWRLRKITKILSQDSKRPAKIRTATWTCSVSDITYHNATWHFQIVFFCLVAVSVVSAAPAYLGYPFAPIPPQPVADTPEVAAAKAAHFAAYNAAAAAAAAAPDYDAIPIPAPVYPAYAAYAAPGAYIGPLAGVPTIVNGVPADTPEVAAAKAAHFAAHAQAKAAIFG